ncbi:MAG: hypothetical protein IE937_01125 [Gammaproteobacteria bacterium]|nr:hypothetical protein [Gammaproteobacteria bacterium]
MDEELFGQEADIDDAIEAFMQSTPDDTVLSEDDEEREAETDEEEVEETEEETPEDDEEESEEDPEEVEGGDDDEDEEVGPVADDEAEVVVSVDGQEHRVSVKDLKRLYGQETSLTQKAQAVAEQRRVLEAQGLYLAKVLEDRYEAAKAKAEQYKDVDLFRASRELEPEEFDALRQAKEAAESELQAIEREGQEFLRRSQETRMQMLREQAKESLKVITQKIPEWNDELYGKIRSYAVSQGMDAELVNEIIEPGAILMMHKAMLYDEAQKKAATVKKKVTKAPKKVIKKADKPANTKSSKIEAMRRNAVSGGGDVDDVAELFLASLNEE